MAYTLEQLAEYIDARLEGDPDCKVTSINTLQNSRKGDISFLSNPRYFKYLADTNASAVILTHKHLPACPTNSLIVDDAHIAYAKIADLIYANNRRDYAVSSTAITGKHCNIADAVYIGANVVIGDNVEIGEDCYIGPGCVIDDEVTLGKESRLITNVTLLARTKIGERVLIHPGAVIGADGFGFAKNENGWLKIPQIGAVVIGDDVEIGANSTIDRGAISNTLIGRGVKIDNQVQIAHNVHIGEHTIIAGCTGIAGSTIIGKRCMIGGAVGIIGHIQIADDVVITGMSFVLNSINKSGQYSSGLPAIDNKLWRKNIARFKKLDVLTKKLNKLEELIPT